MKILILNVLLLLSFVELKAQLGKGGCPPQTIVNKDLFVGIWQMNGDKHNIIKIDEDSINYYYRKKLYFKSCYELILSDSIIYKIDVNNRLDCLPYSRGTSTSGEIDSLIVIREYFEDDRFEDMVVLYLELDDIGMDVAYGNNHAALSKICNKTRYYKNF